MTDYGYTTDPTAGLVGGIMAYFGMIMLVGAAIGIVQLVAQWKMFEKAGRPGWAALVPIYNLYVLYEIAGMKGWYVFLSFIPFVGTIIMMVFSIMSCFKIATAFGKETGFGFGLLLLAPVFYSILGFSKDIVYVGNGNAVNGQPVGMGNPYVNYGPQMGPNPMGPTQDPTLTPNQVNNNMGPVNPAQTNVGPQNPNNGNTPMM